MSSTEPMFPDTPNFRELGGLRNARGQRVRRGKVFRSELLTPMSESEQAMLRGLQIRTVFDLRNPHERAAKKPVWPAAQDDVLRHVMEREMPVAGADLKQLVDNLNAGSLDAQDTAEIMRETYRRMPEHFADVLTELFSTLIREDGGGALVHCTAGKDRTGFVCAMLLSALDVPMDAIEQDYLLSARFFTLKRLMEKLEQTYGLRLESGTTAALAAMVQVSPEYLGAAIRTIEKDWGSVPAYLEQRVGLSADARARLQSRLLED
ncbi:tyrosine-protein phosphatase (plasmid) [Diaphorobacter sp. HDW4B]|uniref:tyrosine-protein phosphatase n=1 Tax=Diaphorobacter sp. HDW4B TaxID=2714925 RepID=UPI001408EB3F|nr:tyrosine-protein phosphatase [Diaphorobacter sp. HDW4B]QIL73986.1 tyrosine-protein phosphatase [Diaphorobacter sp. HDW4B]